MAHSASAAAGELMDKAARTPSGIHREKAAPSSLRVKDAAAFAAARKKFAIYGQRDDHGTPNTPSRKPRALVRALNRPQQQASQDGDDVFNVLKHTISLQANGEAAAQLDDVAYHLDGILAPRTANMTAMDLVRRNLSDAQNVVALTKLMQTTRIQMLMKVTSASQALHLRVRDVLMLLRQRDGRCEETRTSRRVLRLALAAMLYCITLNADADEYVDSQILDLIVDSMWCELREKKEEQARETTKAQTDDLDTREIDDLDTARDEGTSPKRTCLKRKRTTAVRKRSSNADDSIMNFTIPVPAVSKEETICAQVNAMLQHYESMRIGDVLFEPSVIDLLCMALHNSIQATGSADNQAAASAADGQPNHSHRNATATFTVARKRKLQLMNNGGLSALFHIMKDRFLNLDRSVLSDDATVAVSCNSIKSFQRLRIVLRVLDQVSFLATEVQRYLSREKQVFAILLVAIIQLSEGCWGKSARARWQSNPAIMNFVSEVLLVELRVIINLTHHNDDAAAHMASYKGTHVIFRAFAKLLSGTVMKNEIIETRSKIESRKQPFLMEERTVFDALLLMLSALTNCIEFSSENRDGISQMKLTGDEFDWIENAESMSVCTFLVSFFLGKVQSYSRLLDMNPSKENSFDSKMQQDWNDSWNPDDIILGGCCSLLLGCLMKDSAKNCTNILASLPDGSPRLLLRALSAFVSLHSQIGALTPETAKSVLEVEKVLKSFSVQDELIIQSSDQESHDVQIEHPDPNQKWQLKVIVSQSQNEQSPAALTQSSEVFTPPASAFKLTTFKRVCLNVGDSDLESDTDAREILSMTSATVDLVLKSPPSRKSLSKKPRRYKPRKGTAMPSTESTTGKTDTPSSKSTPMSVNKKTDGATAQVQAQQKARSTSSDQSVVLHHQTQELLQEMESEFAFLTNDTSQSRSSAMMSTDDVSSVQDWSSPLRPKRSSSRLTGSRSHTPVRAQRETHRKLDLERDESEQSRVKPPAHPFGNPTTPVKRIKTPVMGMQSPSSSLSNSPATLTFSRRKQKIARPASKVLRTSSSVFEFTD